MNIFAFAFKENISSEVLKKINIREKHFVRSNKKDIKDLMKKLAEKQPSYILGLGMYGGVDKNKLRIETHYSENGKKVPINYFLTPGRVTKLASGIGNSYCNTVSLSIMKVIKVGRLNSRYTFVHIPKSFQISKAVLEIEKMLTGSF